MANDTKKVDPPAYITYALFNRFINGLRSSHIPLVIDRSVLSKMSGGEQSSLLTALRFLGLIDDIGIPSNKLTQLVETEGVNYTKSLRDVLETSYGFILDTDLDLARATSNQVADKFRDLNISGSTVTKSMAFFLAAAKDAGIKVSEHIKPPQTPRNTGANGPKRRRRKKLNPEVAEKADKQNPLPPQPATSWHQQLLEKFPAFDPSWDDETKSKWFDAFNELMSKGEK